MEDQIAKILAKISLEIQLKHLKYFFFENS